MNVAGRDVPPPRRTGRWAAIAKAGGGFLDQLPKDFQLPSWTYTVVSEPVEYELTGPVSLTQMRLQIDCWLRSKRKEDGLLTYRNAAGKPPIHILRDCGGELAEQVSAGCLLNQLRQLPPAGSVAGTLEE